MDIRGVTVVSAVTDNATGSYTANATVIDNDILNASLTGLGGQARGQSSFLRDLRKRSGANSFRISKLLRVFHQPAVPPALMQRPSARSLSFLPTG
jgi:hypothetical protein